MNSKTLLSSLLILSAVTVYAGSGGTSDVIRTNYGSLSGIHRDGCIVYAGIPYAKPPVGNLSFRHPEPPETWDGVLQAHRGRSNALQPEGAFSTGNNSEDCLYLNIFVPDRDDVGVLPVMVWIHGGSYANGGTGAREDGGDALSYDMCLFARETGCVVVTLNYRLNLYGFLGLHSLDDRFDANCGLYDQILALRFVRENIGAFGGDSENITVFGQSAGGACILALMTMDEAQGLFHKAIVQSPCVEHFFSEDEAERNARYFLKQMGVKEPLQLLSGVDPQRYEKACGKLSKWLLMHHHDIRCAFSPVVDGVTLKRKPVEAMSDCKIPLLIGRTSDEADLYGNLAGDFLMHLAPMWLHLDISPYEGTVKQRACEALTEELYTRPVRKILSTYGGPVWTYEFTYLIPWAHEQGIGAFHASELPVLFDTEESFLSATDRESQEKGREMRQHWSAFAHDGNPGWPLWTEDGASNRF